MASLKEMLMLTTEMIDVLNKFEKQEIERDGVIDKMTVLIEKRDEVMKQIKPPYSNEEMIIGKKVVQLNNEIAEKMENIYSLVKEDMNKVKKKKALNRSYINPYGNIQTTDGMYVDSKK